MENTEAATTVVDNPYGLGALWEQGDFVAKGTLIIMVIMSLATWYILVMKLQRSVDGVNSVLTGGLPWLATVGSTAPFVGLFGTVWGIYHALVAIGVSGQASIDKVAGPVGEALIMTAIGLAVAVPAVMGYNWLIRRNKNVQEELSNFTSDLHAFLVSGARVAVPAPAAAAAPAAAPAKK